MKFNSLINTFTSGEWSPKMRARSDAEEYQKSCELLENFIPRIQGGAFRRPGTIVSQLASGADTNLQNALDNSVVKSKMIPSVRANGDRKILCLFNSAPSTTYVVFNAASPDTTGATPTIMLGADFNVSAASVTYSSVGDVTVMTEALTGVGSMPRVWYPNPFLGEIIGPIREYFPYGARYKTFPYLPVNALGTSVNMTAGAATGITTLTASAPFFTAGHVGTFFKLSAAGSTGAVLVSSFVSPTVVNVIVESPVPTVTVGSAAGTSWEEAAWSDYRGWPRFVTAYQGRLIYGGTAYQPDTIWGSRIGNVFDLMERPFEQDADFTGYTNDNSRPFTLTPNVGDTGPIRGLVSGKTLMILCENGEIVGYGTNGALGPNDVSFESHTSFGANAPMAVRTNNFRVFVQKGGRRLRDVAFSSEETEYKSMDLSFVADHLTLDETTRDVDNIVEIIRVENEGSYIYAKTQNGRLLGLAIDRDYKVNAWFRINLGGRSELTTYPLVKSMCSIAPSTTAPDRVYMLVQRYSDGANRIYLEYFDSPFNFSTFGVGSAYATAHAHMDCKRTYSPGAPTTTVVSGLSYLEGETVQVIADGQYIGEKTFDASGNFTVTNAASHFIYGYKCPAKLKTSPIELGNQIPNSPQGLIKRIDEVFIRFYNTYGAKYGIALSRLLPIEFRDPAAHMDDPPALFTGMKNLKVEDNYARESQVLVETDSPFPCNVLAIISKGVCYD